MATREPLIYDSTAGNPRRMTSAEITTIVNQCCYEYSQSPSVTLSVESGISGGSLTGGPISDTRKSAGATSTSTTSFPAESTTQEPQTVTVDYNRITQTNASVSPTSDSGRLWPVYLTSGGNLQAMNQTDVNDTFLHPAIDKLIASYSDNALQGGTYTINNATTLSNCTLVSTNPIYIDTRANTSAYTSSGIPETADQPTTITQYYLFQIDAGSEPSGDNAMATPLFVNSDGNLQTFDASTFKGYLREWIRETASEGTGSHKIRYVYNQGSTQRGTAMANTILDGSGNYQTLQVGDDYRAQEFPNGSATTAATHKFEIEKH